MNKKEQLIADALGDGEGATFALLAASHARRRRVIRQATLASGASLAVLAALLTIRSPQLPPAIPALAPLPAFEIISDEELLVQLKDQPVLLLKGRTGITGVIFLADAKSPIPVLP